jgi:hypothetical protein
MESSGLLASLEASTLATSIRHAPAVFPLIESVHVIGLSLVFGTILIVDLRLLGLASTRRPFTAVASDILKWTWLAFAVTALSGALMFTTNASTYYGNLYFRVKMALLVLAGVNMLVFELTAGRSVGQWDRRAAAPAAGRAVAAVSLVLWIAVIFLGRWVAFAPSETAPAEVDFEQLEDLLPK